MKKLILSMFAASLLLTACHSGQGAVKTTDSAATAANSPVMKFQYDNHDFGKIQEGDKVNYKFSFTNTGKTPLIIDNAQASCGCTIPEWPKSPIKPGDTNQISVTFNSDGHPGLVDKMITVTGNTNPRQTVVHLIGEVLKKK
jgi:predicted small secreted protein